MTISASTDSINLGSAKELSHYTKAVTGGTLHFAVVREGADIKGIALDFVPSVAALASKLTAINVTTGTLSAGDASGAAVVNLVTTNATPGSQAMRTPAQILSDTPSLAVGSSYMLRITNTGAGTLTLATDSGTGFTMTGTMTVPTNTFRDFVVTISTATTGIVRAVGTGTYS